MYHIHMHKAIVEQKQSYGMKCYTTLRFLVNNKTSTP